MRNFIAMLLALSCILFSGCSPQDTTVPATESTEPPTEAADTCESVQEFVDTVRSAGGYNETRNLLIVPYAASFDFNICRNLKLPKDTVEGHLISQVDCYDPGRFCFNAINLGSTDFTDEWGSDAEKAQLDSIMSNIKKRFIRELKIPVIIGEFGTVKRVSEEERAEYVGYYVQAAKANGIKVIIFDDGGDFTVFDRRTLSWPYPKIIDALLS